MIEDKCILKGNITTYQSLSGKLNGDSIKGKIDIGMGRIYPELEDIVIMPMHKEQKFKSSKYGYNEVTVEAIPEGGVVPTGEIEINKNGKYNVTDYASANVNVISNLQEKEVTPTKELQQIIADNDYDGLSRVNVLPISEEYITPQGELKINNNGVYNVREYENANVKVIPNLQERGVTPTKEFQSIVPDDGYDGLSRVDIVPIPDEYIIPKGEIEIYKNGAYDVEKFSSAKIEVVPKLQYKSVTPTKDWQIVNADKGYDGLEVVDVAPIPDEYIIPKLQDLKAVYPSTEYQIIEADEGYDGLLTVDIFPVTADIDKNIIAENIKDGVTILGVQGNLKSEGAKYAPQYISWRQQDATDLTYEVTNIDSSRIISCMRMFDTCSNLTSLDLSSWTLESCNRLGYMFYNSTKLKSIDMSNFDTKNVIYMNSMFYQCKALTSVDISHFNPKSLTNVNAMFQNCIALTEVDISSICTTKINNSALMFSGCTNLTKVIIDSPNVFPMTNVSFFTNTPIEDGTGFVYVPDNLVETYKARTNWTTYANQIKPISELEVS